MSGPLSAPDTVDVLLSGVTRNHGVKVLYACESGSRAWGFPSETSDYDVRFIFVHPQHRYCAVKEPQDQIAFSHEQPVWTSIDYWCAEQWRPPWSCKYDVEGWDLRKALHLLRKMNCSLLEWLHSPFVYHVLGPTANSMATLAREYYSPQACFFHYRHMAYGNWMKYLAPLKRNGEARDEVEIKRYLYVCRALLGAEWTITHKTIIPVAMQDLLEGCEVKCDAARAVLSAITDLVRRRQGGDELALGPRVTILDKWISTTLTERRWHNEDEPYRQIPWEKLDQIMWGAIL